MCIRDRNIVGEQVDVEIPCHGHVDNLTADQVGLGLFGPGKLVHSQIDLKAQVADGVDNALVGEGKGVEGAGEEGDLPGRLKGEGAVVQPPQGDEAVDVGQGCGPVEEGEPVLSGRFLNEEQQLPVAQGKQPGLFLHVQLGGAEEKLADDQQGLLAHRLPVVGQTLEQQPQQLLAPGFIGGGVLGKALPVGGVVLEQHAHRVQRSGHSGVVGGAQQGLEPQHLLVQLAGVEVQGGLPQVLGDVFRKDRKSVV